MVQFTKEFGDTLGNHPNRSVVPRAIQKLLAHWTEIVLPRFCFLCDAKTENETLCAGCEGLLPQLEPACPVCATPSSYGQTCGACLAAPPQFQRTLAVWPYRFPIDRLIQAFKFHSRLELAPWFASRLALAARTGEVDLTEYLVIPMPLHRTRLAARGFNQSAELSRRLAVIARAQYGVNSAARIRPTAPQFDLPLRQRTANVRGAFQCRANLEGKSIVVVDDVMTTGATLNEFARVLIAGGADAVINLVLARTPPPGDVLSTDRIR